MCSLYTVHEITCFCVLVQAIKNGGSLKQTGTLLYHLAAKIKVQISHFIPLIVEYIVANRIDSQQRIDGKYQICFIFSVIIFSRVVLLFVVHHQF
jgi:Glutaminyl-tRNA synthetase, non-specific RNA binding region part 1.